MVVMGPLILLVVAISAPSLAVIKEYHHVADPKNWTEAQKYCRGMYDDLATIESESEWAEVTDVISNSGQWAAWIGMYNDVHSWRWSLDNTDLYDGGVGNWINFINSNTGYCMSLKGDGSFSDHSCKDYKTFVCYDELTNSYIPFNSDYKSWVFAQTYCREAYTDLAIVRNQEELDTIKNMIESWATVWIGLSSESWLWSDQSNSHFRKWMEGYPNGAGGMCSYAQANGWMDGTCQDEYPFICSSALQMTVWKVVKVGLKTDQNVDMSDSQIQGAVLQEMAKELRDQGVPPEVKLSWREHPNGEVFNQTML